MYRRRKFENLENISEEMIEIKKAQQMQEWQGRMENSRYAEGVRDLITEGLKEEKSI